MGLELMTNPKLQALAQRLCADRGFQLVGDLGSGAFKVAFLVKLEARDAALKLAEISGSPERFFREVEALRSCGHSSIAAVLDAFTINDDAGRPVWVVIEEYLGGGTLEQRLAEGGVSHADARIIGTNLAEVLGHLRERRLVHRDIKPANILFRDAGPVPVLTDFGIVRMLDAPSLTHDFAAAGPGTPAYAAPEQLNNEKNLIDWRTDQFGLAVVLAECILGRHPFQSAGDSIRDAIVSVAGRASLPDQTRDELRAAGFASLVQALEPWPVNRYRRPEDLVHAMTNG